MDKRLKHDAKIESVPLEKMRVRAGISQRELRPAWAKEIAANLQIEKLGYPVLNHHGGWYWIIDGQHRIEAVKVFLGEWEGQKLDCRVYKALAEHEEAELFLDLNKVKAVRLLDKYRTAITAGRHDEINVDAIVRKHGLRVSDDASDGSIGCVGTLLKVYRRGADCLDRDLRITHESFGDSGLEADILEGIGMLVSRYNGQLDDDKAIRSLAGMRGGVNALRNRAARLRHETGSQKSHCVAAAAVEVINRGKGGKKLPTWWKQ